MKIIAIIPARGGSKRLPQKNILSLFGKHMIGWTIEAAIESQCFNKILVSTDDSQIANVSRSYGAEVPFFRGDHCDDFSPVSLATVTALEQAEAYWNEEYDLVVQLMPNCPLRNANDIKISMDNFIKNNYLSQISCFKFGFMNPWWAATIDESGKPKRLFADFENQRSQDLPDLYCPSGAIWLASTQTLKSTKTFYAPEHRFFPLNWISCVDIDDQDDLALAQACFLLKMNPHDSST